LQARQVGRSDLVVSELGLGTNNLGTRLDQSQSRLVVEAALALGITFFDTADSYGDGKSEEFLGRALRGHRNEVAIATKVGLPVGDDVHARGASRRWIFSSVEESLKRLRTEWIDLYQVHVPDPETPILETLQALDDLVRSGKVRHVGTSNFSSWELVDADWTARAERFTQPVAAQYVWNLVEREAGANILPAIRHIGVGLITARPLGYGFLTGKFVSADRATGGRLPGSKRAGDFLTTTNFALLQQLTEFAADRDHTILELALGYLLSEPSVSSAITSASTPEQLKEVARSTSWRIATEERASLLRLLPETPSGQPKR
jgi:aryl-alcohol dehydrogenase-like predicted oxidoreductase